MFKSIKKLIEQEKELMDAMYEAKKALALEKKEAAALQKQNKQLLSKIEAAEKRGGVLVLSNIDEGLIEKLQALTPDDNVVVIFTLGGDRIEIRHKDTNYNNKSGRIR